MFRLLQLFGKWQGFKGGFGRLPAWARFAVGLAALPGIILVLLSILAFLVSLLALFLMATPVYRVVSWLSGRQDEQLPLRERYDSEPRTVQSPEGIQVVVEPISEGVGDPVQERPRRQIDVKIVE